MGKTVTTFRTLREFVDSQPRQRTDAEIAEALGISGSMLSYYLSGQRFPSRELALRLSREFNISLEGLLDPEAAA